MRIKQKQKLSTIMSGFIFYTKISKMYKLQNWGNDEKKEAEGLLALAAVIGIILYESMFYIICGILITSILYLAYRIILGIVRYEKRHSVFKNAFNKLKNVLLSAYSQWYFESKDFFAIKNRIVSYIQDCNELNAHINDLETHLNAAKSDYGEAVSVDTSLYDYKRPYLLLNKGENTFYTTNLNLYRNAEIQPYKYFCKYFNIDKDEATLADFEDTLNAFCAIQEGKSLLEAEKNRILETMGNDIPSIIKTYAREKLEYQLGFEEVGFHQLSYPIFTFQYVSAGGLSSLEFEILFDEEGLERFIVYLSNEIKYLQSANYQRALMSKKLREYIKRRDNYTCRYCKNSTHIEANLLLEIDHIIPLSKGGLSIEENLQTLCWRCNRSKGAKIINTSYQMN